MIRRLRHKLTRVKCALLGCVEHERYPGCFRCDYGIYDPDFIQVGKLEPVFWLCRKVRDGLRNLGPKTCQQCGKKFRRGYDEYLCSEECHEEWLPF